MKNRKMLDVFSLADDKYVSEADPNKRRAKSKRFNITAFLASACCLLLILNLVLIVPILIRNNDDSLLPKANDSDAMNHIKNPAPSDNNDTPNASPLKGNEQIMAVLDSLLAKGNLLPPGAASPDGSMEDLGDAMENESSKEEQEAIQDGSADINDNQVEGISEGDIIKKSDKFIYYLSDTGLYVYSINGKSSKLECLISLEGYIDTISQFSKDMTEDNEMIEDEKEEITKNKWEMFLSQDYKTLTIIAKPAHFPITAVVTLDVSRSPTVEIKDFKMISGSYVSSRVVNGELILFTTYRVYKGYNKENPLSYMPFYTTEENTYLAQDIYYPSDPNSTSYLMITRLDAQGLKVKESSAYLSYSDNIYVSKNNIFLTRSVYSGATKTEIAIISYSSYLLENKGTVKVNGYIKDQYSLDEYNGILRVATTTTIKNRSSASLYCIDLEEMEISAMVENFAPAGETVRSVRFDKDYAYVCTAILITDPVFFFDLSDLNNITYTDTGDITGFSTSLINLGDGYVVGIGVGSTSSSLKIEVYKEVDDMVVGICSFEAPKASYSTNYKSYFVDRERKLIGLSARIYEDGVYVNRYLLFLFENNELESLLYTNIDCKSYASIRGFYQNGYYYVVSDKGINTFDLMYFESSWSEDNNKSTTDVEDGLVEQAPSKPAW